MHQWLLIIGIVVLIATGAFGAFKVIKLLIQHLDEEMFPNKKEERSD